MDGVEYDILVRAVQSTTGVSGISCEIGVREGGSSQLIMNQNKERIHIGIDPYGGLRYRANEKYVCTMDYTEDMQMRMLSNLYTSHPKQFIFFPMEDSEFFSRFSDGVPIYKDGKKIITNEYAFVFIDGPHSLEDVRREFNFFKDKISFGGAIVFDDINFYPHNELEPEIISSGFEVMETGQSKKSYKKVQSKLRKVMIGTLSYDGRADVRYIDSLLATIRNAPSQTLIVPIFMSYDSLIQRARNDTVHMALKNSFDDLIFIDSDIEWNYEWVNKLLEYPVDVVGGTYRKKTDNDELYVIKCTKVPAPVDTRTGLMKVDGLGCGFIRLSRKAMQYLWDTSQPYKEINRPDEKRMIFEVLPEDGELVSEDIYMCSKLRRGGFDVHLDPRMCCNHTGIKRFEGNFVSYYQRILDELKKTQDKPV